MQDYDGWLRYHIEDRRDQRQLIALVQRAALDRGCESRSERGVGFAIIDVFLPHGFDPSAVELAIFEATGEDAAYEIPPYSA